MRPTRCFDQIEGFGTYGFPESHAASFALLVYVSAWIKCFYPEVFACALLNSQPMGFCAPAQIVRDAREHGVEVRPVDVNFSEWDCTLEALHPANCHPGAGRDPLVCSQVAVDCPSVVQQLSDSETCSTVDPGLPHGSSPWAEGPRDDNKRALRLGLRQIKGLAEADAERLFAARGSGYTNAHDLWHRSGLARAALERLAAADSLRSLG